MPRRARLAPRAAARITALLHSLAIALRHFSRQPACRCHPAAAPRACARARRLCATCAHLSHTAGHTPHTAHHLLHLHTAAVLSLALLTPLYLTSYTLHTSLHLTPATTHHCLHLPPAASTHTPTAHTTTSYRPHFFFFLGLGFLLHLTHTHTCGSWVPSHCRPHTPPLPAGLVGGICLASVSRYHGISILCRKRLCALRSTALGGSSSSAPPGSSSSCGFAAHHSLPHKRTATLYRARTSFAPRQPHCAATLRA